MKDYLSILKLAKKGQLPDYINENSKINLNHFSELVKEGYIDAINTSDSDGISFIDPSITIQGIEYLENRKVLKKNIHQTTINQYGDNARVNQDSIDKSINNKNDIDPLIKMVSDLRIEIQKIEQNAIQQSQYLELVDAIQEQIQSGKPKKSVIQSLVKALPTAANIAAITQMILSVVGG